MEGFLGWMTPCSTGEPYESPEDDDGSLGFTMNGLPPVPDDSDSKLFSAEATNALKPEPPPEP